MVCVCISLSIRPWWKFRLSLYLGYCEGKGSLLSLGNAVVVVQSISHDRLFATPWTTACQAPLSSTTSGSLLGFMSIELVVLSNFSSLLPASLLAFTLSQHQSFPMSQLFTSGGQSMRLSASAIVLPMNIQGWFSLGLTVWSPSIEKMTHRSGPTNSSGLFLCLVWLCKWNCLSHDLNCRHKGPEISIPDPQEEPHTVQWSVDFNISSHLKLHFIYLPFNLFILLLSLA